MKSIVKIFAVSLLAVFCMMPSTLMGQTKANFAGTWAFNEAKSTQPEGNGPRMSVQKMVVTQDANLLQLVRSSERGDMTLKYTLDGKESVNPVFGEMTSKSTVAFSADGKTMTITTKMEFEREGQKTEFITKEAWVLTSPTVLTVTNSFTTPNGEMKMTSVYDKK